MTGYKGRQGKTRGNKGDKERQELWRRRTHHPYEGAQRETRPGRMRAHHAYEVVQGPGRRRAHHHMNGRTHHPFEGVQAETGGDKGHSLEGQCSRCWLPVVSCPKKEKGSWSSLLVSMSVWLTPCMEEGRRAGDKGRQDPGEGGHTIDLKGHKRGTRGDKGRQDPGEGGHTIHIKGYKRRQGETRFQLSR